IVILPQTIYYSSEEALEKSAQVLNKHPDLKNFPEKMYLELYHYLYGNRKFFDLANFFWINN
ncbi:hypothetical protein AFK68_02090, partial [Hydrocoleum sp. CS-953]